MLEIQNSEAMTVSGQGMSNMNWYKILANTEIPVKEWSRARWTYNLIDYGLWVVAIYVCYNVAVLTYTVAPVYNIFVGLVQLVGIAALGAILQSYNDNKLVPQGV